MDKTAAASIAGKAPTAPGRFWPEGWWRVMEIRIGIIPLPVFIVMGILISVEGANSAAALGKALGQSVRPIPLGSELLASFSDRSKRPAFLRQWQNAIGAKQ